MASSTILSYPISCKGGLDETSTHRELQQKPGWASQLFNFEPSMDGGYRRVNGYSKLGTLGKTPDLTNSQILGAYVHNGGFIICKDRSMYFTYDGDVWAKINKQGIESNPTAFSVMAVKDDFDRDIYSGFYNFEKFSKGTSEILIAVSGNNNPVYITIEGTQSDNTTFTFKELSLSQGSLKGADQLVKYKDQLVISGMDSAPTEIYYSNILNPDDFEGANAGSIGFNDEVMGLKMFRDVLYVFCRNSIHKVVGLETGSPQRQPVTSQLGCVSGNSIQEVSGDLVFLGPDGLRTLSATQRISDINLSTMSHRIQGRLRRTIQDIDKYDVRTTVIRNKSQYRIFFKPTTSGVSRPPISFIMFIGLDNEGNVQPEFSEISGFDVASIHSGYIGVTETIVSGDTEGNIFYHDRGETQDGKQLNFIYQTPFFDLGDSTIRKSIHKVISRVLPEGVMNFNMSLIYDDENNQNYNPPSYPMIPIDAPARYGSGVYGKGKYGTSKFLSIETLTEGSGKVVSIKIFPSGTRCDAFSIHGYDLLFLPAGKL